MNGGATHTFESGAEHASAVARPAGDRVIRRVSALVWVFGGTLFLSAALLFLVEPAFAKMVLPYLGGSPAVWNTCVVFFQAAMLAGYAYAHLLSRRLPIRAQVVIHLSLALAVSLLLPIAIPAGWAPPVDRTPVPSLLFLLLVAVGGPFFVVSSTAPLLQHWFSQTRDRSASDPYFLYAASNLGSITALLAYPSIVEPMWSLTQQRLAWTGAYAAFVAAMVACAVVALRYRRTEPQETVALDDATDGLAAGSVSWRRRLRWLALAFVPSSLMLGVTTFISTDVAAVPLLWVVPLTLYLLSFVVAFSSKPFISQRVAAAGAVITIPIVVLSTVAGISVAVPGLILLHLTGFFAFALLLHRQLADDRPHPRTLTTFYLWISLGGLLGGVFNTLVAPVVFTGVAEYPLMLLAICMLRPASPQDAVSRGYRDVLIPLMLGGLLAAILAGVQANLVGTLPLAIGLGFLGALYRAAINTRFRLTTGVALMLLASLLFGPSAGDVLHAERTFFGVMRVRRDEAGMRRHTLFHGNTLHGEQALDPAGRGEPLSYYHHGGPIGQVMASMSDQLQAGQIGVVGLGAGSLAAYAKPGQRWTFYEIDPAVERIAGSPEYFTYLSDCGESCRVVLGDARLSLARGSDRFDLLILDAFSSDAIPVHLMTREALGIYFDRLTPGGVVAFHISNRHLDLRPILGALAVDMDLEAITQFDGRQDKERGYLPSTWLVMARQRGALDQLRADPRWTAPTVGPEVWTDDFSNVFKALITG